MMQLGFVTAILPDESFQSVLKTASDLGYDCVEVMCWPMGKSTRRYAGITHIDVNDLSQARASEISSMAASYGVSISGLGYYPNPLTADAEESTQAVEHLRKVIDAAAILGIGRVNSFVGRDPVKSVDDNWPRFLQVWKPLVDHAESQGVKIGIENCPMLFTADEWPGGKNLAHSPAIWRRMFDAIPSDHFGLNYDPSHLVFQQMDYLKPMRDFAERIFHVHAKDVRVDRHLLDEVGILGHPNSYHTPKLPGLGEVDWGKFFSTLGDAGYRGPVCVEVEDRIYEKTLDSRKLALKQSYDFLRHFIPKL
jgi:sugar phosphate isomerase/epimerase